MLIFCPISSESQATEKGKRPLYPSGTPSPKKLRLAADDQEGMYCVAFWGLTAMKVFS